MVTITDKILALRHELHQYPELSMKEYHTVDRIRNFLVENTSLKITVCDGWMYAEKQGAVDDHGAIAFRANRNLI